MMRILTVTNMYPYSGNNHYGVFVRDHVEALMHAGVDVDVVFLNGRESKLRYFTEIPRLAAAIHTRTYAVLHAQHSYCAVQTAVIRNALRIDTPLLLTIHEGETHSSCPAGRSRKLSKRLVYWKRLKRFALNVSDFVVTVDEGLPRALGYRGPYAVISPAVDTQLFRPMNSVECRRLLQLPQDKPIVFFPANTERPEKGAELFHASVSQLDAEVHVVYGGQIGRAEMPLYINAANAVVQTSYFEASPMVVKEAMACDTPVVSTDVGDVRSLFGAVPGCFCVDRHPSRIAEALQQALEFTAPVGGRDAVLTHDLSPAAVARRYREVYQKVSSGLSTIDGRGSRQERKNGL
jgi:teichuronic acid biosynthesis glycosyltransferase TuaC